MKICVTWKICEHIYDITLLVLVNLRLGPLKESWQILVQRDHQKLELSTGCCSVYRHILREASFILTIFASVTHHLTDSLAERETERESTSSYHHLSKAISKLQKLMLMGKVLVLCKLLSIKIQSQFCYKFCKRKKCFCNPLDIPYFQLCDTFHICIFRSPNLFVDLRSCLQILSWDLSAACRIKANSKNRWRWWWWWW